MAKGYIIDAALRAAWGVDQEVDGLLLNIGGDLRVMGDLETRVGIADPTGDAETTPPVAELRLRNLAVATSGNYQRGIRSGSHWHSHIFDPRTGRPADHSASVTVVARDAATADALATICSVLVPHEALQLIDSISDARCQIISSDGRTFQSTRWAHGSSAPLPDRAGPLALAVFQPMTGPLAQEPQKQKQADTRQADAKQAAETKKDEPPPKAWDQQYELAVNFEVQNPNDGRRYCRPYVAVWVEDADGFPVRTLALWAMTSGPGPRWMPDLRRWYHSDQMRQLVTSAWWRSRDPVTQPTRSSTARPDTIHCRNRCMAGSPS